MYWNYTVGLSLLISTGGFPRCQKTQMRYFQPEVSFIATERLETRCVRVNSVTVSSFLFALSLVGIDIYRQTHRYTHTYKYVDVHTLPTLIHSRVFTALLCLLVRRENKLSLKVNLDENRQKTLNGSNIHTCRTSVCQSHPPASVYTDCDVTGSWPTLPHTHGVIKL